MLGIEEAWILRGDFAGWSAEEVKESMEEPRRCTLDKRDVCAAILAQLGHDPSGFESALVSVIRFLFPRRGLRQVVLVCQRL